jgi:GAF domain-containing protein/FixJ family two-component response regulator
MTESQPLSASPRVIVIADVDSNAEALIRRVLKPAGIQAWKAGDQAPPPDVLVVDITQLRGDPLASLRTWRDQGDEAPAIVLAAHFPAEHLRDLFRLGVADILLKPYRPDDLRQAVIQLGELRAADTNTKTLARRIDTMREFARRRGDEVRLLSEIGRAVAALSDLDTILTRVVEAAAFVTGAEEASIHLADNESNDLTLRASKQAGDQHAQLQELRVTDTLLGQAFREGQPVMHQPSLNAGPIKVQTGFFVQSLIYVPLRLHQEVVGVLGVYNRLSTRPFDEHHLVLLKALADWAGVALEHAALMRQAQPGRAQAESSAVTAAPPELIDNLQRARRAVESLMGSELRGLSQDQLAALRQIQEGLQQASAQPIAMLDPREVQRLIDLPGIISQLVTDWKPLGARHGIEVAFKPGPRIPWFPGDRERVQQVTESLIASSLHRTLEGRVLISAGRFEVINGEVEGMDVPLSVPIGDGVWAAVMVTDTSAGLPEAAAAALLAPKAEPEAGQLGPGLSMGETRMIAESIGGFVWANPVESGASVTFAFPVG